jgi:very-short-patch-repair endonuclease
MPQFRQRPTLRAQALRNEATPAERRLWTRLSRSQLGHKFSRQMPVGPFIADFLCRSQRLVIELDGGQHCENARDEARTRWIEAQGYRLIRFWNNEVMENMDGVLTAVGEALRLPPPPTPSRMREGKSREAAKGWGQP